jgi:hypothetical protein
VYTYHQKNWFLRHKFLVAIWAIVFGVAGYGGYLALGSPGKNPNPYVLSNQTPEKSSQTQEAEESKELAQIGQTVTDGSLEITTKGIKCGEKTIGTNEYAHDDATGTFCRLQLSIKNTGESAQTLPADKMKLFDGQDKEYTFDSAATLYAQSDLSAAIWYENISAGSTVNGDVVFDIPVDATPEKVLIFGGSDTPGIEVSLE